MACSCRITPLRIFVQGLTQVHKVEAPSSSLLQLRPTAAAPPALYSQVLVSRQTRSFHASRHLHEDIAKPAVPAESKPSSISVSNNKGPSANSGKPRERSLRDKPRYTLGRKPTSSRPGAGKWSPPGDFKPHGRPAYKSGDSSATPRGPRPSRFGAYEPIVGASPAEPPTKIDWKAQKAALKEKFPDGWNPRKRLSPDALAGIRALNAQFPEVYTTQALADKFEVSPENIRRILKSKWTPNSEEEQGREERWFRRGLSVWERKAALGVKPPRKWREEGIARDPSYHSWRKETTRRNKEWEDREVKQYQDSRKDRLEDQAAAGKKT
ncbi:hypothetical protein G7046_g7960 [Stylonectria norvegica]|nr:hypothetical protein G7046_g7960 [Stylonectria norvegica]